MPPERPDKTPGLVAAVKNSCHNFLAIRTEKGAAPRLAEASDGGAAASAGLALLSADLMLELEAPGFPPAVDIVVHRGASVANGRPEDALGFLEDAAPGVGGKAPGRGGWMDTGGEQDFAGVDVPEPGQYPGVQQEVLDGPGAAPVKQLRRPESPTPSYKSDTCPLLKICARQPRLFYKSP